MLTSNPPFGVSARDNTASQRVPRGYKPVSNRTKAANLLEAILRSTRIEEPPVFYESTPPVGASRPPQRVNQELHESTGTCRICGTLAEDIEDFSLRLECELLGFCPNCLDTLFGFRQRRQYHRVPERLRVTYCTDRRDYHLGLSRDVSMGGIFLLTNVRLFSGNNIDLVLPSGAKGKSIRIACKVVRSARDGVGVAFGQDK
jgi:hypothetical protein